MIAGVFGSVRRTVCKMPTDNRITSSSVSVSGPGVFKPVAQFHNCTEPRNFITVFSTNCATEDPARAWQHVNCRSCWIYFMTNLRSVLGGGPDLRDHEHPNWNDSVSIGFEPGSDPGKPRT